MSRRFSGIRRSGSTLDDVILPALLEQRAPTPQLRIWSAGCAAGQEAYSVAMLLAERFGIESVREHVKIYATDIDEEALREARRAVYSAKELDDLPPGFREKYFTSDGEGICLNRDLRRAVMFGRLDLLQDAPISRIDLLLCRNTLMYFNADAQARILSRLSYSVAHNGFLVLGRAEMLFSHTSMFTPVDLEQRVFRVAARANHRDRLGQPAPTGREATANGSTAHTRLRQAAFEGDPTAQMVVDPGGVLVSISVGARELFALAASDVGRPIQELEISYRPVDLRSAMDRVVADQRPVILKEIQHPSGGQPRYYEVTVTPVLDSQRALLGMRIEFADATALHDLQSELTSSKQELEAAYDELQSSNEELETTNEELQSTVEELRSVDQVVISLSMDNSIPSQNKNARAIDASSAPSRPHSSFVGSRVWPPRGKPISENRGKIRHDTFPFASSAELRPIL